jgi:hypothetical protein
MYSVSSSTPWIMRKMPTTKPMMSGNTMTIMPKIMQSTASAGLEIVMPIFFNPLSTTSVKRLFSVSVVSGKMY